MESITTKNKNTFNKVANITLLFWLMKIIATTLGETVGDYISMTLNLGYSTGLFITFIFFILVLFIQLKSKKMNPFIYWLVIISTTILGTEISDFTDRTLHLGYTLGSIFLVILLLITLFLWYKKYKSLAVYPISGNKEIYYWIAILFSNSLGTAFGDYLSDVLGLSYVYGALLTAGIIAIVVALHYASKINQILLFWIAFVFTRPFGATFGDFLTKPLSHGGLNLGTAPASLTAFFLLLILLSITYKKESKTL